MTRKNILVTGAAGFIGSHVVEHLLSSGEYEVYAADNFDPFYDPGVKIANLKPAGSDPYYHFTELDLRVTTAPILSKLYENIRFDSIIHLAARAGVRPSLDNPVLYFDVNVKSTLHLLEFAKLNRIPRFLFASSSSVYGKNPNLPWKESDAELQPISPYAASKVSAEQLGKVYAHLYGMHFISLRLFTVYGPRQRPDLAIHRFYNLIRSNQPVVLYGDGSSKRDYTYVNDICSGFLAALKLEGGGFEIFNLGNNRQIELPDLIRTLEKYMHEAAMIDWQPEQPGDVSQTYADITKSAERLRYKPETDFEEGIREFVAWKEQTQLVGI